MGLFRRKAIVEDEGEEAPGFRADQPIALEDARIREELGFHERHDPDEGLADAVRRIAAARQGRAAPPPEGRSGD